MFAALKTFLSRCWVSVCCLVYIHAPLTTGFKRNLWPLFWTKQEKWFHASVGVVRPVCSKRFWNPQIDTSGAVHQVHLTLPRTLKYELLRESSCAPMQSSFTFFLIEIVKLQCWTDHIPQFLLKNLHLEFHLCETIVRNIATSDNDVLSVVFFQNCELSSESNLDLVHASQRKFTKIISSEWRKKLDTNCRGAFSDNKEIWSSYKQKYCRLLLVHQCEWKIVCVSRKSHLQGPGFQRKILPSLFPQFHVDACYLKSNFLCMPKHEFSWLPANETFSALRVPVWKK